MGLFDFLSSSPAEPENPVAAISQDRLKDIFDRQEWHYFVDDDGDLGGRWGYSGFYFILTGKDQEILHITSRMREPVPEQYVDELRTFIEDWHRDKIWPKAYHTWSDDGQLYVNAEVNIDYEHGASDGQLLQHVHCAIGTSNQLYEKVRERFGIQQITD
ncbi:YbjN domain-containing protein [Schaalia sp. 19OD2882]|uniref:YbjN domain-containing protein n=1 Tax=Schaalia sp. 19OD2882 TaxID=2794089 RepID=UPI001C1ED88E|nr:YbjN domain-containing protein [Schaalia sp. 19OD2882]QWW18869.1 YbjN domain-containing protein [Schaalia sp. 19OD2882]